MGQLPTILFFATPTYPAIIMPDKHMSADPTHSLPPCAVDTIFAKPFDLCHQISLSIFHDAILIILNP
jgi:hypothetical protein